LHIHARYLVNAEVDHLDFVAFSMAYVDRRAGNSTAQLVLLPVETELALALHFPDLSFPPVFQLWQLLRVTAPARFIACDGRGHAQCFMRASPVVDRQPGVKGLLSME